MATNVCIEEPDACSLDRSKPSSSSSGLLAICNRLVGVLVQGLLLALLLCSVLQNLPELVGCVDKDSCGSTSSSNA